MEAKAFECKSKRLAVIIEFPSKQSAIDAYNTDKYEELRKLRLNNSTDISIIKMDSVIH